MRADLPRRFQPHRGGDVPERRHGGGLEAADALGLVLDHQPALAPRILRRDAGRAFAGMAFERLDAAEAEHEGARGVRPVGAERAIDREPRSEEHTSELQSLMRISYDVFCLTKKTTNKQLKSKAI